MLQFSGARALVMGLGLNGGGLESALFLLRRGAELTITDLRDAAVLQPSIAVLDDAVRNLNAPPVRYVLGTHEMNDFETADVVIKNPAVRPDSPYLKAAQRIETDISLFLRENPARLLAVTGSKGKSFTSSALCYGLEAHHRSAGKGAAYLGGNITISPLRFLEQLGADDDVVLELSSWQLADLPEDLLKPRIAVLTAIMPDHLDRYGTMDAYIADKKRIYRNQDAQDLTIVYNGTWSAGFMRETRARLLCYGEQTAVAGACGWFSAADGGCYARGPLGLLNADQQVELIGSQCVTPGAHQKINLLGAGLALLDLGLEPEFIRRTLAVFPGLEHRLEFFCEKNGVRFVNDSAATIPEAAAAAVTALGSPVLITGGTDKALDFTPLVNAARQAKKIILLAGSASDKLTGLFAQAGIAYAGPFTTVDAALDAALDAAAAGDTVVLSPGCTSFGMFKNEFDRGRQWKAAVLALGQR